MNKSDNHTSGNRLAAKWNKTVEKCVSAWNYASAGVWRDQRRNWKVSLVKTLNLSIRSFLSTDLQGQACALTYRTLLAIVPALALLFAIGRGFGFQDVLKDQLYSYFPSQKSALNTAFNFVDSYLAQASEGLFVGVGIVFLLWTMISLLSNVETSFNQIWRVRQGRTMMRKITDYLAILLVLPVLMICGSGLSLLMSTTLINLLPFSWSGTAVTMLLDCASYVITWLFFAGAYKLIPNAKVKPLNAIIAGVIVGTAFQILQWLFLSGQLYVAKYNAIYGSFSFLPLMLIWMQLVWLITLIGGLLCFASQNIGQFNFGDDVDNISLVYRRSVVLAITAIICKRFEQQKPPLSSSQIAEAYNLPAKLVTQIVLALKKVKLISFIAAPGELLEHPLQPAVDVSGLTVGEVIKRLQTDGDSDFIPDFDTDYAAVIKESNAITDAMIKVANETAIISLNVKDVDI